MLFLRNNRNFIVRLGVSLFLFLFLIGSINALFKYLQPNTIFIDLIDRDYSGQVEIYLDITGEGFAAEKIKPGVANDDLMGNVRSLMLTFTEPDVKIKEISMERYFGRLDYYLPVEYKKWTAESVLEDFIFAGSSDYYCLHDDFLHLSLNRPLIYRGDFSRTYSEINDNLAAYRYVSYLMATLTAGLVFFLSGLIVAKWQQIKPYLFKKGSLLYYNNLLLFCFLMFLVFIVLAPIDYLVIPLMIPAVLLGLAIIYLNRETINNSENRLFVISPKPGLILLIIAILIGGIVFGYKVGEHDFRGDEFQVMEAAAGYYYTGDYYSWDFLEGRPGENYLGESYYDRAYPHTYLIAQSFKLLGISELSARLVSVISGILFIPILYFTARYYTGNITIALLSVYAAIFNGSFIDIFRYTRMYILLIPLFIILSVLVYKSITGSSMDGKRSGKLYQLAYQNMNYNYFFAVLALLLLYFAYQVHINVLVIGPSVLLFIIGMSLFVRENKYVILALTGLGLTVVILYTGFVNRYSGHMSFFENQNFSYVDSIIGYPFPWGVGVVLFIVGFYAVINLKSFIKYKMLYLYAIVCFALFFFIFIADRYHHFLYASHVRPLAIILILFSCLLLLQAVNIKWLYYAFIAVLIVVVGFGYYRNFDGHYGDRYSHGHFSTAYQVIVDNYDPDREVIFGQFLRNYYLQDLQGQGVRRVNMLWEQGYSFNSFISDLQQHEAGWVTLETRHRKHLEPAIVDYLELHFEKLHGEGVDNTKVEVYYYDNFN